MSENDKKPTQPKLGLGRGLSALLGDIEKGEANKNLDVIMINLNDIFPNHEQPRKEFNEESIIELSNSIREKGVLQPLLVRVVKSTFSDQKSYQIVAGERRFRAAKLAGLQTVPAIVHAFSDKEVMEIALIENLQRENLSPIDEARAYQSLMERFNHTQESLSKMMGKSRSYIANALRLLSLPPLVLTLVDEEKLSPAHARTIISTDNPVEFAQKAIKENLNVRELEEAVRKTKKTVVNKNKDKNIEQLVLDFSSKINTTVKLSQKSASSGELRIAYSSLSQLKDILEALNKK